MEGVEREDDALVETASLRVEGDGEGQDEDLHGETEESEHWIRSSQTRGRLSFSSDHDGKRGDGEEGREGEPFGFAGVAERVTVEGKEEELEYAEPAE